MTVERGRGSGFETPGFYGAKDVYSGCIAQANIFWSWIMQILGI